MNIQERIDLIIKVADYIKTDGADWQNAKKEASHKNGWFTVDFIQHAAQNIAHNYLTKEALEKWISYYHLDDNISPKNVGIVMAGNIPLVGFHDMLAVFISGHRQTIKLSSKDDVLLKHLITYLIGINDEIRTYISFADMLKGCDAYIATGGNSAAKSFEEYFGKYPNIIRKNKTSVAVLTGKETKEELEKLATDIHLYFGLGCRNVTKLYLPEGYEFVPLIQSFNNFKWQADHQKYKNNYDYNLSILLLNHIYYMTNDATLLVENKALFSPISQLYYEFYTNLDETIAQLQQSEDIQCIVGRNYVPFGDAQNPDLFAYADGVDSMQFLLGL